VVSLIALAEATYLASTEKIAIMVYFYEELKNRAFYNIKNKTTS